MQNGSSNTKIGVSLIASKDSKLIQEEVRGRILKRPEGKVNKRYAHKGSKLDSDSDKSNNTKHCFLVNSGSDIPTSYRINKDATFTPYTNWRVKETGIKLQIKNTMNRISCTSQNKSRPMSYTFTNSNIPSINFEQRIISTAKDFEQERMRDLNSISRKWKIENKNNNAMKLVKRQETLINNVPLTLDSKTPHHRELSDMKVLNYHISAGNIEQEYRITSTILGSGSYAVVKLGEMIDNPEQNVAIKIYEKNKLYASKHRRKNLWNEISVLKTMNHRNIIRLIKVFEDKTNVYLVMEYVKGMSLFKYIKERKATGLSETEYKIFI